MLDGYSMVKRSLINVKVNFKIHVMHSWQLQICLNKTKHLLLPSVIGCPDGSLPMNCLVDPCQYANCSALLAATCQAEYCGGCNARWFIKDIEVTNACGE